jgi:ATP-dependent Clp protease ATP-binding subunit ClpC
MTSNVGAKDITKSRALGFTSDSTTSNFERIQEKVKEEMGRVFNPEFLNRLDDVIVFHPLNKEQISQIVAILLRDVQKRLSEEEITLKLTEAGSDFLVTKGYDEAFGARPLKRSIQRYIEDPLSEKILLGDFAKGDEIEVDLAPEKDKLDFRVMTSTSKAS